jgi:outer membrane murein-binding lipoprotein Lpp
MKNREEYIDQMTAQLKEWSRKIDELEFKARAARADARVTYEQRIKDMKSKREAVSTRLQELKGAGSEAWETMSTGVEAAWDEFKRAFTEATEKFKKTG